MDMDKAKSDLVVWYRMETEFLQDGVIHTRYVEGAASRDETVKEDWGNCGELGRGGFGVVHKQVQRATGRYRAVKSIDKRNMLPDLDYSRELLVMAILAKRPALFVKFLGWFEQPECLYIAMEYLEQGDLTKHIGTPLPQHTVQHISKQILEGLEVMHQQGIAHRDLKPANIFVVSMSPVWVKLGDFGISKRIQAQPSTAFRTQVATAAYSAPEVLGLDSNRETSAYTNSVDIWSLGCVVYELLIGTKLFQDGFGQVSRYFFGLFPFPEDELKGLSPPTDDIGISLLKSMLAIKPECRPTAKDALGNPWLILKNDGDSGDGESDTALRRARESVERNSTAQDNTTYISGSIALPANPVSRSGSNPTTPKSATDSAVITPSGGGQLTREMSLQLELTAGAPQSSSDSLQGPRGVEGMDPQHPTNMSPKPPTSDPPTPDSHPGDGLQLTLGTNGLVEGILRNNINAIHDVPTTRIAHRRTYPTRKSRFRSDDSETSEDEVSSDSAPNTHGREGDGDQGDTVTDPLNTPTTEQDPDIGENPDAGPNPDADQDPTPDSNHNQSPNGELNPSIGGKLTTTWELSAGGSPDIGWDPNAGGDRNLGLNSHLGLGPSLLVAEPGSG